MIACVYLSQLTIHVVRDIMFFEVRMLIMKRKLSLIFAVILVLILVACNGQTEPTPVEPTPTPVEPTPTPVEPTPTPTPIVPTPTPVDPLLTAIENTNALLNYTLIMHFDAGTEAYTADVRITQNTSRVAALDEVIFYEVDDSVCYIYEEIAGVWQKNTINCSEKGTLELQFLINFSASYFTSVVVENITYYHLNAERYSELNLFFGGAVITDFVLTLQNELIHQITFKMTRNSINFDMTITLTNPNQTVVNLPSVT
jgi:hypothetical protein